MSESVSGFEKTGQSYYARTDHRCIQEVLRLTALLLSINYKEVDLSWAGDRPVSIRWDLNKNHVLEKQSKAKNNHTNKTSQVLVAAMLKLQDVGFRLEM